MGQRRDGGAAQLPSLLFLAGLLLAGYLLIPFVIRGFRFPVGPDAPVYLWWTELASHEGLSAVGGRAGVPAVVLVLAEGLGISRVTVLAGFQCAVGTSIGVAVAALVWGTGNPRRAALVCGFLAGVFALYVAAGYFSTLAFLAIFLATVTSLALGGRRGAVLALVMFGAAAVTHPELAALGAIVLVAAAALAARAGERLEAVRVGGAALGGAAVGAGIGVALLAGPGPPGVDTSRDTFLIRVGLSDLLERLYVRRIFLHAWTYVPFASVPLAVAGINGATGFLRRLLLAWGGVTVAAIAVGTLTGWFPPERALSAALALPILAGLGIEVLLRRGSAVATAVATAGFVAIVAGAGWNWWHTAPPVYEVEAARASEAARYAAAVPAGTPLVFQVSGPQPVLTFFATRAANEIRAAMPSDRIRDVVVVVPPPPPGADEERRTLWATYEADVRDATGRSGLEPLVFRLTPFIRAPFPVPPEGLPPEVERGVRILGPTPGPVRDLQARLAPTSLAWIVASSAGSLVVFGLAGLGWVRAVSGDTRLGVAWAPTVGLAMSVFTAVSCERLGVPIGRPAGALVALTLAAVPGWVLSVRRPEGRVPSTRRS